MKDKVVRKVYPNLKNIDKSKTYLVGLSGGADSVSLLRILHSLKFKLVAVHVHHNVRKESDGELDFCKELANELNIPFKYKKLEFKENEKKTQNGYREKRFEFFKEIYEEVDAEGLFLGQHLDDQVENSVVSFFKRKSVLTLKAMSTKSELLEMNIYRPLLNVRKHEILEMTDRHNIQYVTDKSNFEEVYERNKVRLSLIPLVERIFGKGMYKTLEEMIESANEQEEINKFYSSKLLEKFYNGKCLDLACLSEHSLDIVIYSLNTIMREKGISADKATFNDVKDLILKNKVGKVSAKKSVIMISKCGILVETLKN